MTKNSKTELAKNTSLEIAKIGIGEIADNVLGKLFFGVMTAAITTRNKFIAEKLIERLENSEIKLTDDLIQSNEFLGYTAKVLEAINTSTKKKKMGYLLNIYINGLSDENFYQRSENYVELIDIISSLSEDSINVMVEVYKYCRNEQNLEINHLPQISQRLNMTEKDVLSHCYLLSGKGLIEQQNLLGSGFSPLPSSWLEDVIRLLNIEINN